MKKPTRYVLEAIWSGYIKKQKKVWHREIIPARLFDRFKRVHTIQFGDLTTLSLEIRPALPRERIEKKLVYSDLIRQAVYSGYEGWVSVAMLNKPKKGAA